MRTLAALSRVARATPRFARVWVFVACASALSACGSRDTATTPANGERVDDLPVLRGEEPSAAGQGTRVAALDKTIFVVFQAADDTYWFGSDGHGVFHVDGQAIVQFTTADGLRGNRIRSIQQDRAGHIYVNSDGGVSRWDGRGFRALNAAPADPAQGRWRLDDDDLWFTGWQDEGIVYRYDGAALHRLAFPSTKAGEEHIARYPRSQFPRMTFSPYDVYVIYRDRNGHMWFGTGTLGACRYDGRTFAWVSRAELEFGEHDGFGVRSIVEDKDGKFWFSRTLHRLDVAPSASTQHGNVALGYRKEPALGETEVGFTHIMSAVRDKDGTLWMAALDGNVWRFDGTRLTRYPVRAGDAVVTLFSISKDRHGGLWLGTHEYGAYRFNGATFEQFKP